jgi:hypothetical protein
MAAKLGLVSVLTCAALLSSTATQAQLAPGFDAPDTLLAAAKPALGFACFLVSTGRPWPGIDSPLLGMEGEGLVVETEPVKWFADIFSSYKSVRYSSLNTPEGKLWIGYAADDRSCTIGAEPADKAAFSKQFLQGFPHAAGKWRAVKSADPAGKAEFKGKLQGSPERWNAQYWESAAGSPAVFARMSSSNK